MIIHIIKPIRYRIASRCVVMLCTFFWVFAFSENITSHTGTFQFTHYTSDDGLSQSNITSIAQDPQGFMWFGTFNGLNRFDAYDFQNFHYNIGNPDGLSHNFITALFVDSHGKLWIGTSDGLNCFDTRSWKFSAYHNDPEDPGSISDDQIESILEDQSGRLWVGTRNNGLNLYSRETGKFIHYSHKKDDSLYVSSNFIHELFEDENGTLWIAHGNGAIDLIEKGKNTSKSLFPNGKKLTNDRITAIAASSDTSIWIGTQGDGLYQVIRKGKTIKSVNHWSENNSKLNSDIILSLLVDRNNNLWVGTEDKGINLIDLTTNQIVYILHDPFDKSSLSHNSVWSIFEDNAGNIWIGTYAYGINLFNRNQSIFRHYEHHPSQPKGLNHNMINAFWEDNDDILWIATDGGGVNILNRESGEFRVLNTGNSNITSDVIVTLHGDIHKNLWIGTWSDGLFAYDKDNNRFIHYGQESHGLGSDRILNIVSDKQGGLWLATFWGGLTYLNPETGMVQVFNTDNSELSDNNIRTLMQDHNDIIWIGSDIGLDCFNPQNGTFTHFRHESQNEHSLLKGFVHTIIETSDSVIWVGTAGGLNRFYPDINGFIPYTTQEGLPDNEIKAIVEETPEILWLSTNLGICRFEPQSGIIKNYDINDGLQGNEFNPRSAYKTSSGEIAFGGNNGFNLFHPDNLIINPYVPPVVITDFRIYYQSILPDGSTLKTHISMTDEIRLSYRDAVFSIEFAALNFIAPEKNLYQYQMIGFDEEWIDFQNNRIVTYTNLDHGHYLFRVRGSNNDGVWNEEGASLAIIISPPFWKTGWAYVIEILIVLLVLYFIINHYVSRQRLENALKLEQMQLDKVFEMDQMKSRFFSNISHEFFSPLTLILSPLERLIQDRNNDDILKNSLNLILRNARRLQRMIYQLKDFQKLETGDLQLQLSMGDLVSFVGDILQSFQEHASDHQITLTFNPDRPRAVEWFDADKLDKIIYNLLSNAFKYTPDNGIIQLNLNIIENSLEVSEARPAMRYVEIIVKDSGIGIPKDKQAHIFKRFYRISKENSNDSSGIGLSFVYELVKICQGEIRVDSEENQGSAFTVLLPIDDAFTDEQKLIREDLTLCPEEGSEVSYLTDAGPYKYTKQNLYTNEIPLLLLVEDDRDMRNYIQQSLEKKYRILLADDGKKGVEEALNTIPDLIISDIKMPRLTGVQLCNQLKGEEKTSHIPIILLTAYSSKDLWKEGLHKGADAYVNKPFSIDVLEAQISNLLLTRRHLREKFSHEFLQQPGKIFIEDIDKKFLTKVIQTIHDYISESDLNADMLCRKVGMSRIQLYRKLRSLTNQTVHEFITNIRLQKAVHLLEEKRMTITDVAFAVGFNDLTYFARCFRKRYHKSPSEYRLNKERTL